jgi:hypothetical protein
LTPFSVPAAWAALYLVLHSFIVKAEAGVTRASDPSMAKEAREVSKIVRLVIPGPHLIDGCRKHRSREPPRQSLNKVPLAAQSIQTKMNAA